MRALIPSIGRKRYLAAAVRDALHAIGGALYVSDIDGDAPAIADADFFIELPPFGAPGYWGAVDKAIACYGIDAVLPVRDAELLGWAERAEAGQVATRVCVSPASTLRVCRNKLRLYDVAAGAGLASPRTWPNESVDELIAAWPGIVIGKPVDGSGGRGIAQFRRPSDLARVRDQLDGYLLQQWIEGPEFSVDCFFDVPGDSLCACFVRERLHVKDGECVDGRAVERLDLIAAARTLAELMPFVGVVNLQFIEAQHGPLLIDVNPRFPGGLHISEAAGCQLVSATIRLCKAAPVGQP